MVNAIFAHSKPHHHRSHKSSPQGPLPLVFALPSQYSLIDLASSSTFFRLHILIYSPSLLCLHEPTPPRCVPCRSGLNCLYIPPVTELLLCEPGLFLVSDPMTRCPIHPINHRLERGNLHNRRPRPGEFGTEKCGYGTWHRASSTWFLGL